MLSVVRMAAVWQTRCQIVIRPGRKVVPIDEPVVKSMMGSVRLLADDNESYFSAGEPWVSEQRDADGSAERNQQGEHVDVIPESHADILDKTGLAHLATIGPNGEPQVSPVWYGWDGRYIRVSHTPDRQKYRNVRRDPRVALSITDPDDPYRRIEIRGRVERIDQDPDHAFIDS